MRKTISAIRRISLCTFFLTGYVLQVVGQTTVDTIETVSTIGIVADPAVAATSGEEAQQEVRQEQQMLEQQQEQEQEKAQETDGSMYLWLVLMLALISGVAMYVYKENRKVKQSLADMGRRIKELESHMENPNTKEERLSSEHVPLRIQKNEAAVLPCSTGIPPVASSQRIDKPKAKPTQKALFATIRMDNGKLSIDHRSITDSPAGKMFQLNIVEGTDEGTYVISPSMTSEALNNLNALNDYVDFKRPSEKPTGIVTCKEGTIRKENLDWVVTKKLEIKFKY